jgi:hypothetical protein
MNLSGITIFNCLESLEQDKKDQQLQMPDYIPQINKQTKQNSTGGMLSGCRQLFDYYFFLMSSRARLI